MADRMKHMNQYVGSSSDDFLAEEGILEEATTRGRKRPLALQLQDIMEATHLT